MKKTTILAFMLLTCCVLWGLSSSYTQQTLSNSVPLVPPQARIINLLPHSTTPTVSNDKSLSRDYRRLVVGDQIAVVSAIKNNGLLYEVLRSSLEGQPLTSLDIGTEEVLDIAENAGKLWILSISTGTSATIRLTKTDTGSNDLTDTSVPMDSGTYRLVSLKSGLFGITRSGNISCLQPVTTEYAPSPVKISLDTPDSTLFKTIADNSIAVVDQVEAKITVVNTTTGVTNTWPLNVPEVVAVKESYRRALRQLTNNKRVTIRPHTIHTVAANNGLLFVMLSGFRAEDGAPVFKLDTSGQLVGAFRLPMGKGPTAIIPEDMAFRSGELYVLSSDGQVFTYTIR